MNGGLCETTIADGDACSMRLGKKRCVQEALIHRDCISKQKQKILVVSTSRHYSLFQRGFDEYSKKRDVAIDWLNIDLEGKDYRRYIIRHNIFGTKETKIMKLSDCFKKAVQNYEKVLFVNLDEASARVALENEEKVARKGHLLLVDVINHYREVSRFGDGLKLFKKRFTFEYGDIVKYINKYDAAVRYVTLGSSYCPQQIPLTSFAYDISFVFGGKSKKRFQYLDSIARWCLDRGVRLFVAGHFWHNSHVLQRAIGSLKFRRAHPDLFCYLENRYLTPEELACVYRSSKICLNINQEGHENFNLRGFDVMTSNSLLVTEPEDLSGVDIENGKHFIMAENVDDMLEKIEYFLDHEEERRRIAQAGFDLATKHYSFTDTLDFVFGDSCVS